jgi:hypothetical protein
MYALARSGVFAEEEVRNRMCLGRFRTKETRNIQDKGAQ